MSSLPKIFITDIDGVWTDGGMYYDQTGNELKKFNTSDSAGVLFLQYLKIPVIIITSETTEIVNRRSLKLNVNRLYQGVKDKLNTAYQLCDEFQVDPDDIAFIGDDLNDIPLLKIAGYSCTTRNAPDYVKKHCKYITDKAGGEGAFREFVEMILIENDLLDEVIKIHLNSIQK